MSKSKPLLLPAAILLAFAVTTAFALAADTPKDDPGKKSRDIDYVEDKADDQPEPPIRRDAPPPEGSVPGVLLQSNGERIEGSVHLTRDAGLKFTDPGKKKLLSVRLDELTHVEQRVVEEHMEKEWRWLENASDKKVFTGKEYPVRELETVLHFKDGRTLAGPLTAPIFVANANGDRRFLLHKRQKGDVGTKLADLVYVRLVDFRPQEKPGAR
jgi:hypothetical protein